MEIYADMYLAGETVECDERTFMQAATSASCRHVFVLRMQWKDSVESELDTVAVLADNLADAMGFLADFISNEMPERTYDYISHDEFDCPALEQTY